MLFISVNMANPNGDPLMGNRPRMDYDGYGEISDVCIKRKLRNRMQDMGQDIFVQSADRVTDGCRSLAQRADTLLFGIKDPDSAAAMACERWMDVRTFGQVFSFKGYDKAYEGVSLGIRGPVSIHQGVSLSPIDIITMQITRSVNGQDLPSGKATDTMGTKHLVRFGLYRVCGAISVQLAEKTGFTVNDTTILKEALRTLFINDASASRPEGSMEVCRLYWWQHNNKYGQYSSAQVHRSVHASLRDGITIPRSVRDYEIIHEELPGLVPEVINGC